MAEVSDKIIIVTTFGGAELLPRPRRGEEFSTGGTSEVGGDRSKSHLRCSFMVDICEVLGWWNGV
jgi:hypothetical protein